MSWRMFIDEYSDSLIDIEKKYEYHHKMTSTLEAINNSDIFELGILIDELSELYIWEDVFYDDFMYELIEYVVSINNRLIIDYILDDIPNKNNVWVRDELTNCAIYYAVGSSNENMLQYILDQVSPGYVYYDNIMVEALKGGNSIIIEEIISSNHLYVSSSFYNNWDNVKNAIVMSKSLSKDIHKLMLYLLKKYKSIYYNDAKKL